MRSLFSLLGLRSEDADEGTDAIRRIAAELDRLDPDRARYIAAFAFVLSRAAGADQEISPEETTTMERLVVEHGGLPQSQATLVVQLAKTQQRLFGGTDDFLVTRELGRIASYEQKLGVIRCLFAVAAADEHILAAEADEIARIGRELGVRPEDLSSVRARYRNFLEVRRGLPDA
jgi:uncharacterized tellurite resistance protein B-like protein